MGYGVAFWYLSKIISNIINSEYFDRNSLLDIYEFDVYMEPDEYKNIGLQHIYFNLTLDPELSIFGNYYIDNYNISKLKLYGTTEMRKSFSELEKYECEFIIE